MPDSANGQPTLGPTENNSKGTTMPQLPTLRSNVPFSTNHLHEGIEQVYLGAYYTKKINEFTTRIKEMKQALIPYSPHSREYVIMGISLKDAEEELQSLKAKLGPVELEAIKVFHAIVDANLAPVIQESDIVKRRCSEILKKHLQARPVEDDHDLLAVKKELADIKEQKLSREDCLKFMDEIMVKNNKYLLDIYSQRLDPLLFKKNEEYVRLQAQYDKMTSDSYINDLKETVTRAVLKEFNSGHAPENLEAINTFIQDKVKASQEQLAAKTKALVQQNSNVELLQTVLSAMPEFSVLKQRLDNYESSNSGRNSLLSQLEQQINKQSAQLLETQDYLESLHSHQAALAGEAIGREKANALKTQVTSLISALTRMKSRVKRAEETARQSESEIKRLEQKRVTENSPNASRKRPKTDEHRAVAIPLSGDLENRIRIIENKQNQLIDLIYQFRSTVLHPQFPENLESCLTEFESVLKTHELCISYLIDPITAGNHDTDSHPLNELHAPIAPSMLQSIHKLVQQIARNSAEPLLDRIQQLESKLQARNG